MGTYSCFCHSDTKICKSDHHICTCKRNVKLCRKHNNHDCICVRHGRRVEECKSERHGCHGCQKYGRECAYQVRVQEIILPVKQTQYIEIECKDRCSCLTANVCWNTHNDCYCLCNVPGKTCKSQHRCFCLKHLMEIRKGNYDFNRSCPVDKHICHCHFITNIGEHIYITGCSCEFHDCVCDIIPHMSIHMCRANNHKCVHYDPFKKHGCRADNHQKDCIMC